MFENYPGYTKLSDNADVRIAVDKIADLVSSMTIHLVENGDDGDKRIKNALSRKIDIEPCRNMTRKTWLYRIVKDMLLDGDGNSIVRVKINRQTNLIEDLIPLSMDRVDYEIKEDDYQIWYKDKKFKPDEVMHFVINPDDEHHWKGNGYKTTIRDIVKNLNQANATRNSFMNSQYMPNIIVKVDSLSEELSSEEGRDGVKNKFLKNKPGEPLVIPAELLEVEQVKPLSLKDIAINESTELDKRTIAGIFGVPAFFLGVGDFDRDEYNNFINTRIMSIAQTIAQTLTRDLLYSEDWYFRLNPRSLYSYALTDLVNAGGEMVKMNAMRRNELRDWVGLDPDEEMEELIVLENYIPQGQLGDQEKLKGGD